MFESLFNKIDSRVEADLDVSSDRDPHKNKIIMRTWNPGLSLNTPKYTQIC